MYTAINMTDVSWISFFQNWLCSFAVTIASALGIHSNLSFERNMSDYYTKLFGVSKIFWLFFFHIWKKLIFLYSINLYINQYKYIYIHVNSFVSFIEWTKWLGKRFVHFDQCWVSYSKKVINYYLLITSSTV